MLKLRKARKGGTDVIMKVTIVQNTVNGTHTKKYSSHNNFLNVGFEFRNSGCRRNQMFVVYNLSKTKFHTFQKPF